jgi:hypothetical protein
MRNRKKDNAEPYVRDALLIWLDPDMHWHGVASGKRGRSVTFSDTAVEFCLAVKNLFGLPLRDAVPLARKLLLLAELNWSVPDFSTVSRRRKRLRDVTAGLSVPPGLHLLIDDSGIRIMGEGEWECRARGNNCARQWRKLQLIIKDQ